MAKPTYALVLLPGDGIGVEVVAHARAARRDRGGDPPTKWLQQIGVP